MLGTIQVLAHYALTLPLSQVADASAYDVGVVIPSNMGMALSDTYCLGP